MKPSPHLKSGRGVYAIRNTVTGLTYVGQTVCMFQRCRQHVDAIRTQDTTKINRLLLADVNTYGLDRFTFEPLEFSDAEDLRLVELAWIKRLQTYSREYGYNLRTDDERGMVVHPETSALIRANMTEQYAAGKRSGHGEKLRRNWKEQPTSRHDQQANVMRRAMTKWLYVIGEETIDYRELVKRGLATVQSSFHKLKSDVATCKGVTIKRVRNGKA